MQHVTDRQKWSDMLQSKKRTIDETTAECDHLMVECERLQERLISRDQLIEALEIKFQQLKKAFKVAEQIIENDKMKLESNNLRLKISSGSTSQLKRKQQCKKLFVRRARSSEELGQSTCCEAFSAPACVVKLKQLQHRPRQSPLLQQRPVSQNKHV